MARFLLAALALVFTEASAQTVINFNDGSTYTLTDDQEIYISTPTRLLFSRQVMANKDTFFRVQSPWITRDYVATPADDYEVGSHNWCSAFIPWSEGLTFDQITWNRYCDTNDDGVYDENDDRWA
tara:strand:+ start:5074 stop:5448 length:375 start_codon:yes stop_codon:yes gene_type:complete